MNRNKLSLIIAGLAAVALVLGGWFVGVQPQLASAAASAQQQSDIDARNDTVRAELARLEHQYDELGTLRSGLTTLQSSIPDSTDTTPFIKELNQLADANAVSISSLTFGDAQAYVPPATAEAPAPGASATATPSPSASASSEPEAAASSAVAAPKTVTDPLITSSNFIVIPVSVSVDGSDAQALAFTSGVQKGSRLFLVNSIGTGSAGGETADTGAPAATTSGSKTWTLAGFIFVLDTTATATASSPAAAPANG